MTCYVSKQNFFFFFNSINVLQNCKRSAENVNSRPLFDIQIQLLAMSDNEEVVEEYEE